MNEPKLAQQVAANFDHVLVDEYQDTNRLQGEIVRDLRPDGAGVTVVGDDAQSIYSFRGAVVENILGFPDQYTPKAEIITLAQNYRATQPILDVANALMADAPRQHRKHLLSVRGAGRPPAVRHRRRTADRRPSTCARQVLKRRETGVLLRSQAVLFRNASASDMLEVELLQRKIPFVKYGGPQVHGGRARQGHARGAALGRQPAQRAGGVPRAAAPARHGPGARAAHHRRDGAGAAAALALLKDIKKPAAALNDLAKLAKLMATPVRAAATLGRARCAWCATGTSRTWSASTSRPTRASATWTSSSRSRRSFRRASASSPSWRSIRPMPRATCRARRSRTRTTCALDRALGQGHGVGHRLRAQRRRRELSLGVLHRPGRPDRRGTPAPVRGDDARAQRAAPVRAAQVPAGAAAQEWRRARVRRAQPLRDREGAQVLRARSPSRARSTPR